MEKYASHLQPVLNLYEEIKASSLYGRYITQPDIAPLLEDLKSVFSVKEIGKSVKGKPVHSVQLGNGKIKVLAWSQMHGNESTTTKAAFDLLMALKQIKDQEALNVILKNCSLRIIPMLNPDGAQAYTRVNANQVDLNRDANKLQEVESRILRAEFNDFQPDFCLNLHDQRTIFSAGEVEEPATLSFLTPSRDPERQITADRIKSMQVIAGIADDLKEVLPNRIGRYDDSFNINCTGDTFQSREVPTLLFEAGHHPGDYQREQTRKFVFAALVSALHSIATGDFGKHDYKEYFEIPGNRKLFNDIIFRNAALKDGIFDVSIQFKEELKDGKIEFIPIIEKIASEIHNFGHREIDCKEQKMKNTGKNRMRENVVVNKITLNKKILEVKCE